jgi:hypothetical protein
MRTRLLAPGFFKNEDLAALDAFARLCFAGLWCLADREGRLEDRPKRIRAEVFPYDDVDVDALLTQLADAHFIVRYSVGVERYISIPAFLDHQTPHHREAASVIPPPMEADPDLGRAEPRAQPDLGRAEAAPRSPVSVSVSVYGKGDRDPVTETPAPPVTASRTEQMTVTPLRRPGGGGVLAGSLPRDHLRHAWCGERLCVPMVLHGEFVRAWGGEPDAAEKNLHAWYGSVVSSLPDTPIGDDPFKFWRSRFAAAFPSGAVPVVGARPRGCTHQRPCTSEITCTRKRLDAVSVPPAMVPQATGGVSV